MEHSPGAIKLTVEPVTVHTLGVVPANVTPSPDVALAERFTLAAVRTTEGNAAKSMV